MRKLAALTTLLFLNFFVSKITAQNLDSLHNIWENVSINDSIRFDAMKTVIWNDFLFNNPDTAYLLAEELKQATIVSKNRYWEATAVNIQGTSFYVKGEYSEALNYFEKSKLIQEEIGNTLGIAAVLGNIGVIYFLNGAHELSLGNLLSSLEKYESLNNKNGVANALSNIGLVYKTQEKLDKALTYYHKSLAMRREIGDKGGIAGSLSNLGSLCQKQGKIQAGLDLTLESLALYKELGDNQGTATTLLNAGGAYRELGQPDKAIGFFNESIALQEMVKDQRGIANALANLGLAYLDLGKTTEALQYSTRALQIAQENNIVQFIGEAAEALNKVYEKLGNDKEAYKMYKLHIQMRDSVKSQEITEKIAKMESKAELEKQLLLKEQQEKEAAAIQAEMVKRRNSIQYSGIGLGLFALFGSLFLFGRIQLPRWAIELCVFLPFLILFEFLLVISDPYVDVWSAGEPLIKLGINVLMAGAIFPLHAFFERLLKQRLFKKS